MKFTRHSQYRGDKTPINLIGFHIGEIGRPWRIGEGRSVQDRECTSSHELSWSSRGEARPRAESLLWELGLGDRLQHCPSELSSVEKQRVAVAHAPANNPQLILADEPTGNLDSKSGHAVAELSRKIAKEQGKGVVIVSHDMRTVDIADRVLWLEDGRLREETGGEFATDPICGMRMQIADAAEFYNYRGERYCFDSLDCLEKFKGNPEKYIRGSHDRQGM